jgi:DNA gyrase/topoisomerase IV subunit B
MSESKEQQLYVRVKDFAGNEFVCPIEALKNPKEVSEEVLDNCVDNATVGRYAGNIEIVK